jgi:lysophospholipase L1-like esterase
MTTRFLPRSLPVFLFLVLFLLVAGRSHAETYTVDAFGDSITAGWWVYARDGNGCVGCGGYEPALQSLLKSAGRDAVVKNWGRGGESTSGGASRVGSVLSYDKPRYILLMEGTNDLLFLSPYTVRANMAYMVDVSLARGVVPVLGTITPDTRNGKPINLTNTLLRELAAQKKIALADHYSALISNWSSLSVDGLHPNSAGYAKMAQIWSGAMDTADTINSPPAANLAPILMLLLDE